MILETEQGDVAVNQDQNVKPLEGFGDTILPGDVVDIYRIDRGKETVQAKRATILNYSFSRKNPVLAYTIEEDPNGISIPWYFDPHGQWKFRFEKITKGK